MGLFYRQCSLRKKTKETSHTQVSWIPERYAIKGKFLKLKEDNGWEVLSVGAKQPASVVNQRSRDWKKTRKASDI